MRHQLGSHSHGQQLKNRNMHFSKHCHLVNRQLEPEIGRQPRMSREHYSALHIIHSHSNFTPEEDWRLTVELKPLNCNCNTFLCWTVPSVANIFSPTWISIDQLVCIMCSIYLRDSEIQALSSTLSME